MPIYDINGNVLYDGGIDPSYSDSECKTAFLAEMNKKAASIGMSSTTFATVDGASSTAQTTTKDMALLTMIASGYKRFAEVWSKNSYTIYKRNGGSVTVNTTVSNATLEAAYPILGGKTGSWSTGKTLACLCDVNGEQVAGYVAGASSDSARFSAMKQLMDIAATILSGGSTSATVTDATSATAIKVPTCYPMNYEQQTPETLYAQADTTSIIPASTTKIINALVMLDWINDISSTFAFKSSDMVGGSGSVFSVNDIISFRDALYAMMLPSSNQTAHAVARVVGNRILSFGS